MENGCHIVSMQSEDAGLLPTFDRSVHSESGARIAELVDEILRLHGRVMSSRKPSILGNSTQAIVLASVVLALEPPTVARIARSLGYTRQAIQKTADLMVGEGYVVYADNPHHKRSRQLLATEKGRRVYEQVNRESAEWTEHVAQGLDAPVLLQTLEVLRQVRRNLEGYSDNAGASPKGDHS
ncbi:hypothetical protein CK507_16480 [Pseudomonas sp. WN033]|nr:hypothetical protein CK507_16480 [Pseudomonas sp. WN033]